MAGYDPINRVPENGHEGDTLYTAAGKINAMFDEVFIRLGDTGNITFVNSITASTGIEVSSESGDITITNTAPYINSFTTLAVIGQQSLLANTTKTLTFVPGSNVGIAIDNTSNRITISATSQVAADWDQTDINAVDYIKHKPTIPTDISQLEDGQGLLIPDDRFGEFVFDGKTITTLQSSLTGEVLITPYDPETNINVLSGTYVQMQWAVGGNPTGNNERNMIFVDTDGTTVVHNEVIDNVQVEYTWNFSNTGNLVFPDATLQTTAWAGGRVVTQPTTSVGATGDKAGDISFSSSAIFYCTADYSGSDIWVKTPWATTGSWS